MITYFAHAEELHAATTSPLIHTLTQWYVAIPLFIVIFTLIIAVAKEYTKLQLPQLLILSLGIFFTVGILAYSLVPALSVICLTLGISLALFFVLISIAK